VPQNEMRQHRRQGGVSNVEIDKNKILYVRDIRAVISTSETLPPVDRGLAGRCRDRAVSTEGFYHGPVYFRPEELRQPSGGIKQGLPQAPLAIRVNPAIHRKLTPSLQFAGHCGRTPALRHRA